MTETNAWADRETLSVTIKYGKGYEETWVNFRGDQGVIRRELVAYFGMEDDEGLTLHEVVLNATTIAHGTSTAAGGLKAVAISSKAAEGSQNDAWSKAEAQAQEPAVNPLYASIEAAGTVEDLRRIWAENQGTGVFQSDPELLAAWKARGKAIQAGAAA